MPFGAKAAHIAHAAGEAAGVPLGTIVVVLAVPNESTLRDIARALGDRSLTHALIEENEGELAGQATAIGLAPIPNSDRATIRKVVSHLPLVR